MFKRLGRISLSNKLWGIKTSEGKGSFKALRPGNELLPLNRRISRYRRDKNRAIEELRRESDGKEKKIFTWEELDFRIQKIRCAEDYDSEVEEGKEIDAARVIRENKGKNKGPKGAPKGGK